MSRCVACSILKWLTNFSTRHPSVFTTIHDYNYNYAFFDFYDWGDVTVRPRRYTIVVWGIRATKKWPSEDVVAAPTLLLISLFFTKAYHDVQLKYCIPYRIPRKNTTQIHLYTQMYLRISFYFDTGIRK